MGHKSEILDDMIEISQMRRKKSAVREGEKKVHTVSRNSTLMCGTFVL